MKDSPEPPRPAPRSLREMGLANYAPYLMNRIMGRYNASLRDEMRGLGLTIPKMRALAVLSVFDGLIIRELAAFAMVEQSTLSRALDGLEAEGLVRREVAESDGRATLVSLTEDGHAAFDRLWPHMAEAHARLFRGIPEEQRRAFVATLQVILGNTHARDT
jgi:DNA-binding MarR family transcriptional regulator